MQVVQGPVQNILQSGKAIGNGHFLKLGANQKGLDGLLEDRMIGFHLRHPLNIEIHEEYREVIFAAITIQYITGRLCPEFLAFVDFRIGRWQKIPVDIIDAMKTQVALMLSTKTDDELIEWLSLKIAETPYNDAGLHRVVTWKALGPTWKVYFKNDYATTSVAEQFIAMFQIYQADIVREDSCILKTTVEIHIELTDREFKFEYDPDGGTHKWIVRIPVFDLTAKEEINRHYFQHIALMQTMLNHVSLLPSDKNYEIFERHVKDELGAKTSPARPYEQIYREIISHSLFVQSRRTDFQGVKSNTILPKQIFELNWPNTLSQFYDPVRSGKAILSRYKNTLKGVYLTLEKYKSDVLFKKSIQQLRNECWKDWHILLALYNAILNYKANLNPDARTNGEVYQKTFQSLSGKDERDVYVEIPVEVFTIDNVKEQLNYCIPFVLRSYGLEHKPPFIEFDLIKELLIERFNFMNDDVAHETVF